MTHLSCSREKHGRCPPNRDRSPAQSSRVHDTRVAGCGWTVHPTSRTLNHRPHPPHSAREHGNCCVQPMTGACSNDLAAGALTFRCLWPSAKSCRVAATPDASAAATLHCLLTERPALLRCCAACLQLVGTRCLARRGGEDVRAPRVAIVDGPERQAQRPASQSRSFPSDSRLRWLRGVHHACGNSTNICRAKAAHRDGRPLPERPHRPLRSLSCRRAVAPITVLVAAAVACTAEPAP